MLNHIMRGRERARIEKFECRAKIESGIERLCDQDPMAWGKIGQKAKIEEDLAKPTPSLSFEL